MSDDLSELYQQVILDHCKRPRNFHDLPNPSCSAQGHSQIRERNKLVLEPEQALPKSGAIEARGDKGEEFLEAANTAGVQ